MGDQSRTHQALAGKQYAALQPEQMRDYLLEDGPRDASGEPLARGGRLWCDRIIEGVARGDRTALRLYGEAMKWVGAQTNIAAVFVGQLGVRDEAELKTLVESGRKLERMTTDASVSLETYRDEALELLKAILTERPEWRNDVVKRLSGAEVVDTSDGVSGLNGHGEVR